MEKTREWKSEIITTAITQNNARNNNAQEFFIMPNVSIKEELDTETINDPLEEVPQQLFPTSDPDQSINDSINDNEILIDGQSYSSAKETIKDCIWFEQDPLTESVCRCRLCDVKIRTKGFLRHLKSEMHRSSVHLYAKTPGAPEHSPWFEPHPFNKSLCRCWLCDQKICTDSFKGHTRSKMHKGFLINEPIMKKIKCEKRNNAQQWEAYKKRHPWIYVDPLDSNYAYCKYCKKRLFFMHSEAKRLFHETNIVHKRKAEEYENLSFVDDDNEEEEEDTDNIKDDINTGCDYNDTTDVSESSFPSNKPDQRKYHPWLDYSKRFPHNTYCKYCCCRYTMHKTQLQHARSKQHQDAIAAYKERLRTTNSNIEENITNASKSSEFDIMTPSENDAFAAPAPKRSKIAYESAVEIAQRLTEAHLELLRLTRQINNDDAKSKKKTLATDITTTCVSSELPVLKEKSVPDKSPVDSNPKTQETASLQLLLQSQLQDVEASSPQTDTLEISKSVNMDESLHLFISSISETVKKFPVDLIAEWKMKVMQILYSLELRAWRRQQGLSDQCDTNANASVGNVSTLPEVAQMNNPIQQQVENKRLNNSELLESEQQLQNANLKETNFAIDSISTNKEIYHTDQNEKSQNQEDSSTVSSSISTDSSRSSSNSSSKQCTSDSPIEFNKLTNIDNITQANRTIPISEKLKTVPSKAAATSASPPPPPKLSIHNNGTDYLPTFSPRIQVIKHTKLSHSAADLNPLSNNHSKTNGISINKTNRTNGSIINLRHIQINSQTQSKVIPVNTWTHPPQRRLSLNLTPQQLHHTINSSLRGSPQKATSTTTSTSVSTKLTGGQYYSPQQFSTPK